MSNLPLTNSNDFITTTIVAENADQVFLQTLKLLHDHGDESSPRGLKIRELVNFSFKLTNPRKRMITLPMRRMSLPYAFGEWLWYLTGSNDMETMAYYGSNMKNFSDDGVTLNSAYGYRIFGKHKMTPFDQWQFVVDKLREDKDSRQAIIHLHTPNNQPTKDEVCTLTLQFMIRNEKLDMIVNMRSNDLVWGLTYDLFNFTMIQELIANELDVEVGNYYHNAGSMHIYENYFHLFNNLNMYDELIFSTQWEEEFRLDGLTRYSPEWNAVVEVEEMARQGYLSTEEFQHISNIYKKLAKFPSLQYMIKTFDMYNIKKHYPSELENEVTSECVYESVLDLMLVNYFMGGNKIPDVILVDGPDGSGKSTYIDSIKTDDVGIIHLDKPTPTFNKKIYYMLAQSTFNVIFDRTHISELVYSKHFGRKPLLNYNEQRVLESLLNAVRAKFVWMDTDYTTCYNRLDTDDRKTFSEEDMKNLQEAYLLNYRVSGINNKVRYSELVGELQ